MVGVVYACIVWLVGWCFNFLTEVSAYFRENVLVKSRGGEIEWVAYLYWRDNGGFCL